MPISCHFRDCKALLFESRKQRYYKYPDLYPPINQSIDQSIDQSHSSAFVGVGAQSTSGGSGARHFAGKYMYEKLTK